MLPKLKRLLSDSNSSLHEVVDLVRLDPGIAARVLQIGNSAYYNQGLRCYTVDEAVHRVGYEQIYQLVSNAVASEVLVRPLVVYQVEADGLWENAIACAIAAEMIAAGLNIDRDIAYTIGLLHQVGMVAVNEWLERSMPQLRFTRGALPLETCEEERRLLGFHNGEAGAALLRLWDFPAVMSEPVRWQYLPAATAAHGQLASLLNLAKWIRTVAIEGDGARPPDERLLRKVAINTSRAKQLVEAVRAELGRIRAILGAAESERHVMGFPSGMREVVAVRD
ncbi:MAG: HDOD domain-containing protein [Candidatus Didemnitutus sp.]|nr:HDOD domain-containing protein [Candidatus Didemnitutus sp.]